MYSCSPASRLPGARDHEILFLERGERVGEVDSLLVREPAQRAVPEGLAHDRCVLKHAAARGREGVEPRGEHGVNGVRQGLDVLRPLLADAVDHLLGEQGVAAGRSATCGTRSALPFRSVAVREQRARRARASRPASAARARSRCRCAGRRPSPGGARAARRAPGRRSGAGRASSGPGTRSGRAFPRPPSGCPRSRSPRAAALAASTSVRTAEKSLSRICCGSSASCTPVAPRSAGVRSRAPGDRGRDALGGLLGRRLVAAQRLDCRWSSFSQASSRVVGVDDPELAADHLAERPVGHPRAVGRAAPRPGRRRRCPGPRAASVELPQQSRLSDPGLPDHGDQVWAPFADDAVDERKQQRGLVLAADQRRSGPRRAASRGARTSSRTASQAGTGSDFPFSVSGSSSSYSIASRVSR